MKNIVIYGTDRNAKRVYQILKKIDDVNIIAFTDDNQEKVWTEFCCVLVLPLEEVAKLTDSIVIFTKKKEFSELIVKSYDIKKYYLSVWDYLESRNVIFNDFKNRNTNFTKVKQRYKSKIDNYKSQYFNYYKNGIYIFRSEEVEVNILQDYLEFKHICNNDYKKVSCNDVVIFHKRDIINESNIEIIRYIQERCSIAVYVDDFDIANELHICDFFLVKNREVYDRVRTEFNNVICVDDIINVNKYNPIARLKRNDEVKILNEKQLSYPYSESEFIENCIINILECNEYKKITPVLLDCEFLSNKYVWDNDLIEYIKGSNYELDKELNIAEWRIYYNANQWTSRIVPDELKIMLACGNLVLSNYNRVVNEKLSSVFMLNNEEDIKSILLGTGTQYIEEIRARGIRNVISNYSIYSILERIYETVQGKHNKPLVTIIVDDENSYEQVERQTYSRCNLVCKPLLTNEEIEKSDYITFFARDIEYGEFYVEDMINGFKLVDVEFVTCSNKKEYINSNGFQYVNHYDNNYNTIFTKEYYFDRVCNNIQSGNGLIIDTLELDSSKYEKKKRFDGCKVSVIIPIYNNGDLFINKSFNSLLRCSMFEKLQIILVDDGSDDSFTLKMVRRLDRKYANVSMYLFEKGGSGSASRPRNKGIELARCRYLLFLDPDDEVTYDGYEKLYNEIINSKSDVVLGNVYWVDSNDKMEKHRYYASFLHRNKGISYSLTPKKYIIDSKFEWMGFCNMIFDKDIILRKSIYQKEGILSEDLLFVNEVFLNSTKVKAIDEYIYYYYASISNSQMNNPNIKYFEKKKGYVVELYNIFVKYKVVLNSELNDKFQRWFIDQFISYYKKTNNSESNRIRSIIVDVYNIFCSEYGFVFNDKRILDVVSEEQCS